ncbi:MAG: PQQ-binding-like beta-propeller repeat protein, partial [Candidatus Brocadiae bacterium]|nr:PQQ-binding-like beta-propeller repeat protein [Candidatus Brocadiia bacterium]
DALREAGLVEDEARALAEALDAPKSGAVAPVACARLALALGSLNNAEALQALESRDGIDLRARVRLRGKSVAVSEAFRIGRARLRPSVEHAPSWASWPTFGGSPSRDRLAGPLDAVSPPNSRYAFEDFATREADSGGWRTVRNPWNSLLPDYRPVLPAVADGVVVVNEGNVAWAADLVGSGDRRLWSLSSQPAETIMFDERVLSTATVRGGLAWMSMVGSSEEEKRKLNWLIVVYPIPLRKLVCVDVQTGRIVWQIGGQRDTRDPDGRTSYHGAPVVDGERLYCAATYWQFPTDPVQHYVVCLEAATGKELWRTFICQGFQEINLFNNNTRESIPLSLTLADDRIYTCTNLGIVACVDALEGSLRWARRYPRFKVAPIQEPSEIPRQPMTWFNNPILVVPDAKTGGARVLVTPMDGPFLFSFSADDGSLQWKFSGYADEDDARRRPRPRQKLWHLLGARNGVVYLSGQVVTALHASSMKYAATEEPLPGLAAGRGVLAVDGVYIPATGGLLRLQWAAFEKGARAPDSAREIVPWPARGWQPGNLILVDRSVLCASNRELHVAYDAARVRGFIEGEIRKNPKNPFLRYRLALCLQQAGEAAAAEAALREALELAGKMGGEEGDRIAETCRRALYHMHTAAAEALLRKPGAAARAAEDLERARGFAQTDSEWLDLLFGIARARRMADEHEKAILVLQEVIEQHGGAILNGEEPARDRAARDIQAVVERHGRATYAAVERRAEALLAAARASGDPSAFDTIIRDFPNSASAETAAFDSGHALFAAGDWAGACDRLAKFADRYPASPSTPQAVAELAVSFEKRLMWGMSAVQLRRLRRSWPDRAVTMDGREAKAGAWAEARLAGEGYRSAGGAAGPPVLELPLVRRWAWNGPANQDATVLVPVGIRSWKTDLLPVSSGPSVFAVETGSGRQLWKAAGPPAAYWAAWSAGLLVIAGDAELTAYREDGAIAWRTPVRAARFRRARESDGFIFLAAHGLRVGMSHLAALDASNGALLWSADVRGVVSEFWLMEDRFVWLGSDRLVQVADRTTGVVTARWELSAQRVVQAGPDRLVAWSGTGERSGLAMYEVGTGRKLWSQPMPGIATDLELVVGAKTAAVCLAEGETTRLKIVELEGGKLLHDVDIGAQQPRALFLDGEAATVVMKSREGSTFSTGAWSAETGKPLWATPLPDARTIYPCAAAKDHLVIACPERRQEGPRAATEWVPVFVILDRKSGAASGRIEGRPMSALAYSMDVIPGRVLLGQGESLEVYGK